MIRLARTDELPRLLEIYEAAKAFMRESGNPNQWGKNYPGKAALLEHIGRDELYVYENERGKVCACFALIDGEDPTYSYIEGGKWISNAPYGTIHRVASDGTEKGIFKKCVGFARERFDHLRIDTHKDNKPMQHCIQKQGFSYCGIIYLEDGAARLAYEWIK
jgi:hypothetical protein